MQFLRYDNPIMSGISKIANCILLSILWLIGCIPVITVGVSTSALYYTVEKNIKHDRGYVISSFCHAYKENLKQATVVGVVLLAVETVFLFDFWILDAMNKKGIVFGNFCIVFQIFMGLCILYAVWTFAMLGRFQNTVIQIMKNSFIIMIRHIGSSLVIALFLSFGAIVVWLSPIAVCLMPAITCWLISVPVESVFKKYVMSLR